MRKEKMVTRTIEVTHALYKGMDIINSEIIEGAVAFTGNYSEDECLKLAKNQLDTDSFKVVYITDFYVTEKLYGMPEIDFLENAVELDPETRKPL